jgi:hypothetical protein
MGKGDIASIQFRDDRFGQLNVQFRIERQTIGFMMTIGGEWRVKIPEFRDLTSHCRNNTRYITAHVWRW